MHIVIMFPIIYDCVLYNFTGSFLLGSNTAEDQDHTLFCWFDFSKPEPGFDQQILIEWLVSPLFLAEHIDLSVQLFVHVRQMFVLVWVAVRRGPGPVEQLLQQLASGRHQQASAVCLQPQWQLRLQLPACFPTVSVSAPPVAVSHYTPCLHTCICGVKHIVGLTGRSSAVTNFKGCRCFLHH